MRPLLEGSGPSAAKTVQPDYSRLASSLKRSPQRRLFGHRNRLTVIDIDARGAEGERLLADVQREVGNARFIVRNGGGGFHLYYRHAGEGRKIRLDPRRPIDLLGGGQIVLPPSRPSEVLLLYIDGGPANNGLRNSVPYPQKPPHPPIPPPPEFRGKADSQTRMFPELKPPPTHGRAALEPRQGCHRGAVGRATFRAYENGAPKDNAVVLTAFRHLGFDCRHPDGRRAWRCTRRGPRRLG